MLGIEASAEFQADFPALAARALQQGQGDDVFTSLVDGYYQLLLGRSPHNIEFDASPGTSGHIRYFTFDTLERLVRQAGLEPLGRWTNVAHFSVLGSSELVGRLRPGLGHTLISLAAKPSAVSSQPSARGRA